MAQAWLPCSRIRSCCPALALSLFTGAAVGGAGPCCHARASRRASRRCGLALAAGRGGGGAGAAASGLRHRLRLSHHAGGPSGAALRGRRSAARLGDGAGPAGAFAHRRTGAEGDALPRHRRARRAVTRGRREQAGAWQLRAAASLGHGQGSAWLRIVLPQLLHDLRWPLVIVFVYGATVVDMALVLGPTQPPTLAVVIWHALNDAEPQVNRMGLAGTLLLTAGLALALGVVAVVLRALAARLQRQMLTRGAIAAQAAAVERAPRGCCGARGAGGLPASAAPALLLAALALSCRFCRPR